MPRIFQFSTQSGRSIRNARIALDTPRPLDPIRQPLTGVGVNLPAGSPGHVWGFSPESLIAKRDDCVEPGDVGLRVEPGRQVSRMYEVLAFFPGRGDLAQIVNGKPWHGGGDPYPNLVVFRPFNRFPAMDFRGLIDAFLLAPYVSGVRFEARFLSVDSSGVLRQALGQGATIPIIHVKLKIPSTPRPSRQRMANYREGSAVFREMVLSAQRLPDGRVECAACATDDERIMEAAHLVDYGYIPDDWWNGLPMCRNHHRHFDLDVVRLNPSGNRWESAEPLSDLGITKQDLSGLARQPHPDAVRWKWQL